MNIMEIIWVHIPDCESLNSFSHILLLWDHQTMKKPCQFCYRMRDHIKENWGIPTDKKQQNSREVSVGYRETSTTAHETAEWSWINEPQWDKHN